MLMDGQPNEENRKMKRVFTRFYSVQGSFGAATPTRIPLFFAHLSVKVTR
jgi:hypothetical protein